MARQLLTLARAAPAARRTEFRFAPLRPGDPGQVGRYPLRARLGAGGTGRVFLTCTPGGRPVAVKILSPEARRDRRFAERFAHEVDVAQRIDSGYVARLLDADVDAERPWLASAYVCGPTLQELVDETGPLSAADTMLIGHGMARALTSIHAAGVLHRDLKPANVMLDEAGPKVIDFGIARPTSSIDGDGVRLGTVPFMSPEQVRGQRLTVRSDAFALGCTLYFLATGRPAFGNANAPATMHRILYEEPDLSVVDQMLRRVLQQLLAKDPAERSIPSDVIGSAHAGSYVNLVQALPLIRERTEAVHAFQTTPRPIRGSASAGIPWRTRLRTRSGESAVTKV